MQFKLQLSQSKGRCFLPFNYQYELSQAISRLLEKAEPFNNPLLSRNCIAYESNGCGPFTFSQLKFDGFLLHQQNQRIEHIGQHATLEIRFGDDNAAWGSIKKMLLYQQIVLGDIPYQVSKMEVVSPVEFNDVMFYRCLTPLSLLAKSRGHEGDAKYLSPSDEGFHKIFKENLLQRLLRFQPEFQSLKELDRYCPEIQFELLNEPKRKGITLKRSVEEPLDIIGYQFDFKLKASPILHELGYYEGFGSQSALGFGYVEVLS